MTPDPGRLRRRLVIEAPTELADGAGGVVRSHVAVATVWAAIEPRAGRDDVAADTAGAVLTHRIVLRAGPAITPRHRLRLGDRLFRIVALRDLDPAGRFVVVDAEERIV
ncbi:hypothetical protein RHODGE_RHODGE_04375 [Rhodoplanes serenus]|uniref:Head-tail adaptor protein n=1 Tax=Rhodoplanes serenus TaxID=200615 RepID=A0A3S4CJK6_9BRAD|nr:phage head closure protein [Rhodoplanes serenus]VCU10810.1 hypothetical protein RHODGE_RHODGE_04375 [Rhodoplanes serenus]